MISKLDAHPVPAWLESASEPLGKLPLKEILSGSVYYPASGFDGQPVQFLGGNFHSFVYVDYGTGRSKTVEELTSFRGYHVLAYRDVGPEELAPAGWPLLAVPEGTRGPPEGLVQPPFCLWVIFEREVNRGDDHGPRRFSLLFVGGDGVATFQAIYSGNSFAPAVIAVIQPGTGFGGNWTNFSDPEGLLAKAVRENPAGVPSLLLNGGVGELAGYREPCWPSYQTAIWERTAIVPVWALKDTRSLRLWGRAEGSSAH